ncbi:MAG: SUMF1/EgtB/PvdO family nonheme iron enzyme [Planctomycetes bacterium]|nr:SUMF1/EgtB/PvdO family nonheme iron enzyme [Planctomycetota bacterium]
MAEGRAARTEGRGRFDRYELKERLGRGRHSEIYKAVEAGTHSVEAVKILDEEASGDEDLCRRIERMAKLSTQIDHETVLRVFRTGRFQGRFFYGMEFVAGESLGARFRRGRLSATEAVDAVRQVARALAEAHRRGTVHADLTAASVLVGSPTETFGFHLQGDRRLAAKLMDLGLSPWGPRARDDVPTGPIWSYAKYAAPEVLGGVRPVPASDVWALGVLAYEALSGHEPFPVATEQAYLRANRERVSQPLAEAVGGLPEDVAEAVDRMLLADPSARPTAEEVEEAFTRAMPEESGDELPVLEDLGAPVPLADEDPVELPVRRRPREEGPPAPPPGARAWASLAGGLAAAAVLSGALVWWLAARPRGGGTGAGGGPETLVPRVASAEADAAAAMAEGDASLEAGDYPAALRAYRRARYLVQGGGASVLDERVRALRDRWAGSARALEGSGDWEAAAAAWLAMETAYPGDEEVRAARARARAAPHLAAAEEARSQGRLMDAASALEAALRADPSLALGASIVEARVGHYRAQAREAEAQGRWTEAATAWRHATMEAPGDPSLEGEAVRCEGQGRLQLEYQRHMAEAGRLEQAGELEAAIGAYTEARGLAASPGEADERIARARKARRDELVEEGRGLFRASRMDEAAAAFGRAEGFAEAGDGLPGAARAAAASLAGTVYLPGGEVRVGCDEGAQDERPAHVVTLAPFLMDRLEVSRRGYAAFVEVAGHRAPEGWGGGAPPAGEEALPVVQVSWEDAAAYARWALKRLPTEEEWEAAARGAPDRAMQGGLLWPWGEGFSHALGNFEESGRGAPVAVDSFPEGASPSGCLHMAGNVAEWTASVYGPYPGSAWRTTSHDGPRRVIRGGSFHDNAHAARVTARAAARPDSRTAFDGFRCAADVPEVLR